MKLANFAALDPSYSGVGMRRGGRRDAEVWDRYHDDPGELAAIADALRAGNGHPAAFPLAPEEDEDEVAEGRLLYRRHRTRERSSRAVAEKKASAQAAGSLVCEVCSFDFKAHYGDLGAGFIECHHLRPLSETGQTVTKQADLALLCSNCHRMAHRGARWPTLGELRVRVAGAPWP